MPATTKKYHIELSAKSIRFVLRAIDFQMRDYESRLASGHLSEDEEADLRNDLRLFEIIRESFRQVVPPPPSD